MHSELGASAAGDLAVSAKRRAQRPELLIPGLSKGHCMCNDEAKAVCAGSNCTMGHRASGKHDGTTLTVSGSSSSPDAAWHFARTVNVYVPRESTKAPAKVATRSPNKGPLFLCTHVPKAGGTSFVIDLAMMRGARPCDRDLRCVHAERDCRVRPPNASAVSIGSCNLLGCEGYRDDQDILAHALASVRRAPALRGMRAMALAAAEAISRVKDIVLLRSPVDHVVSMYAHCQQRGGLGKRQGYKPSGNAGPRPDISLPAAP